MITKSTLFIVNDINQAVEELKLTLPIHSTRIIRNEEEGKNEFLIAHATKTIKEAFIATSNTKYIIICADSFRVEAQNSLLKVLEEPPKNIIFIIVTISKNSILPTILSRVAVKYQKTKKVIKEFKLNLAKLELKDLYTFLKENQRINKNDAKDVLESVMYSVSKQGIKLTQKELHAFSQSMKLLELNSRPINVLTTILLNIMLKR
jgi:DNA polymerase-3 subunit delta'